MEWLFKKMILFFIRRLENCQIFFNEEDVRDKSGQETGEM